MRNYPCFLKCEEGKVAEIIIDFFKNPANLILLDQKVVVHLHLILHQLQPCGGLVLMSSLMLTMIKLITTGEIYGCKHCETHLALAENIVSKSFHSRHGKAYLFSKVVNVTYGKMETRMMMTGMHTVADIFCVCCGSIVGWKYETAHERSQKYKEGKSVLERFKLSGPDGSHYWASHETHVAGSDADDV